MSSFCLNAYRAFLLAFAVWGGAGMFDSISGHFAWWADPVAYVSPAPRPPGMVNAWIPLTLIVVITVLVSAATMWRYRGAGRGGALATLGIAALILLATFAYFVPQLGVMGSGTLSEEQLIAHSRAWIALNAVRLAIVLATAWWGLVLLGRFERRPEPAVPSGPGGRPDRDQH